MRSDRRDFLRGCLVALGFAVAPAAIVTSKRPRMEGHDVTVFVDGVRLEGISAVDYPSDPACLIRIPCSDDLLETPLHDIEAELRSNLIRDLGRALDKEMLG